MNIDEFKNLFNNCEIVGEKIILKSDLLNVIKFVKENYHFEILKEIIAIDNKDYGVELIYHLFSVEDGEDLLLSIVVNDKAESVTGVFASAIADENEIYDLFGIKFIGNGSLKRLYMPKLWRGNPLKKDYVENDERLRWND